MIVSYRWLCRLLGFEVPLNELLERLTMNGLEIEALTDLGAESGKVVVGQILEMGPHPNAENLVLAQVNTGGPEPLRIVCGAKNMKPGDFVPVAIEGAKLPNGLTIKKSKIRGETSMGMMCSGDELGWSEDHAGLLILPPEQDFYKLGTRFEALIDIKVTPNRPDCLSVYGIARDVAAAYGKPTPAFPPAEVKEGGEPAAKSAKVRVDAKEDCPRYVGRVIRGVKVEPSPLWLQRAVESAGLRSISNIVDVTNYVLLELGHPLHAFDLDKVANGEVIVRLAREGEEVVTLDGQTNKMMATDLLITDPEKPIALAGIMGCGNTEITEHTTNVFLECAYFTPATIRKTSKRLGKSTDSSYRFERGTDWQLLDRIVDRAARLIVETAGGQIALGVLDEGREIPAPAAIELVPERMNALLGLALSPGQIAAILQSLGFSVEKAGAAAGDALAVRPPAYRPDVTREADLAEEIARITGYDRIPAELPRIVTQPNEFNPETRLTELLRDVLVRLGLMEVTNYTFLSAETISRLGFDAKEAVELQNPLSAEYAVLRTSLIPGLLESVMYNQNHGQPEVRLFEVGKVFRKSGVVVQDSIHEQGVCSEEMQFAAVIVGPAQAATWRAGARQADFFDGKAIAQTILEELRVAGIESARLEATVPKALVPDGLLHPGKSAVMKADGQVLLAVGELHPKMKAELGLKRNAVLVFGNYQPLLAYVGAVPKYQPIPVFPSVTRDLALVADRDTAAADIEAAITKRAKSMLAGLELFDVYEGERIAADKKSLAYSLEFSARDRTLKDDEVNEVVEKILADLKAKLGVELRA